MTGNEKPYDVGFGKPPKHSQFKPGQVANPGGKTSEAAKAERKAGEIAAKIQLRMLEALEAAMAADDAAALSAIASDPLKLIKDAMDREFGTAVQKSSHTHANPDGSPITFVIRDMTKDA